MIYEYGLLIRTTVPDLKEARDPKAGNTLLGWVHALLPWVKDVQGAIVTLVRSKEDGAVSWEGEWKTLLHALNDLAKQQWEPALQFFTALEPAADGKTLYPDPTFLLRRPVV